MLLESYINEIAYETTVTTDKSWDFSGASTVKLPAGTTINGSSLTALGTITSSSAQALAVGLHGLTNPAFNVDSSAATQADGLNVAGAAAGSGAAVSVITSGTNAPLTIDAAGSGTITIAGTSTGGVTVTRAITATAGVTSPTTVSVLNSSTATSGGVATAGVHFGTSTTNSLGVYFGSDAPTITAPKGSLYLCTNGSSGSTRLYVNSSGTTVWVAITTAS